MAPAITRKVQPLASTRLPDSEALVRSENPRAPQSTQPQSTPIDARSAHLDQPDASPPPRFKSSLTKTTFKQYRLNGESFGPIYPGKPQNSNASTTTPDRVVIFENDSSVVYQRRNPSSPFIKKIKKNGVNETQHLIDVRNELAAFVSSSPYAKNFAVEVFVGERNGQNEYIARKINGFRLDNAERLALLRSSGEISDAELSKQFDVLADAVQMLNASGYFHNDINRKNIMYDSENKTFVLIDCELADKKKLYGSHGERQIIETYKEIVFPDLIRPARTSKL